MISTLTRIAKGLSVFMIILSSIVFIADWKSASKEVFWKEMLSTQYFKDLLFWKETTDSFTSFITAVYLILLIFASPVLLLLKIADWFGAAGSDILAAFTCEPNPDH